ncbi:MAG: hypothetical protein OXC65_07335 [Thiotrichales bacterium]|nr:hypothetical protein [Thiotrichales bacterium]
MNRQEIDAVERDEVDEDEFLAALEQVLLAPRGEIRSENRQPTREELERRYRLERR